MLRDKPLLSVVVPVFNEEETIAETVRRLLALRIKVSGELATEFLLVDDGSTDGTLAVLREAAERETSIKVISFSRNFGHQMAITAGMDMCQGDYVAVIDADLQDPPELIEDLYHRARQGFDVVYGKRKTRSGETMFKRATAAGFGRMLSYLCEIEIPADTGDFRLMSRRVVDSLKQMRERHRFVRGMVPWIGFKSSPLEYDRAQRFAGATKFPLRKMIAFAANAVFSFSRKPLTVASNVGFFTIVFGVLWGSYMLYLKLFTNIPVQGLTAILITIVIFSGVQILLIGVAGEYIARIFEEIKGRPLYLVAEKINL
jgi:polyisoprenyl-phosphate glycosyltransferase